MEPEKGEYGLWYAGTVGFATKEQAQDYIDRGGKHSDETIVVPARKKDWSWIFLSFAIVAAIAIYMYATRAPSGGSQQASTPQDVRLNEIKLQRLVRSWVVAGLKDPDSAQFRNQYGVCGEVNAKNALGGYVGYRRFIAVRQDLVVMDDGLTTSPSDFEKVWATSCNSSPTGSDRLP